MPKVTLLAHDGRETVLEVPLGHSVMETAVQRDVDGIRGECGGSLNCATCHVFVASDHPLPAMDDVEDAMLDATVCPREATSRLSCQIVMTAEMDGLVLRLPEFQD